MSGCAGENGIASPPIFHKKPLDSSLPGYALPADVASAIADVTRWPLVTCVLNTIDDALDRADPGGTEWTAAAVRHLLPLLERARYAGRIVILTADHGHVVERRQGTQRPYPETSSGRSRSAAEPAAVTGRSSSPAAGSRCTAGRAVLAVDERVRFGPLKAGYHGGATPAEAVVPVAVLVAGGVPEGTGLHLAPPQEPSWWADPVHRRTGPAAPPAQPREAGADRQATPPAQCPTRGCRQRPQAPYRHCSTCPARTAEQAGRTAARHVGGARVGRPAGTWPAQCQLPGVCRAAPDRRAGVRLRRPGPRPAGGAAGRPGRPAGPGAGGHRAGRGAGRAARRHLACSAAAERRRLPSAPGGRRRRHRDRGPRRCCASSSGSARDQPAVAAPPPRGHRRPAPRHGPGQRPGPARRRPGPVQPGAGRRPGAAAGGGSAFKAVRGEYGAGKTFFTRYLAERALRQGFAAAEVQISETQTPLHRLETVYRRITESLRTASYPPSAFRPVLDSWLFTLEADAIAADPRPRRARMTATSDGRASRLLEQRLAAVSRQTPAFAQALRAYRAAAISGDRRRPTRWPPGSAASRHVAAAARRSAGIRGELDHFGAMGFLQGLLDVLRDAGHPGLLLVLDEVETLQRVRGDVRDKALNALRQLIDEIDAGRYPGLFLVITGTPPFYDGPSGVSRLPPLAQRLATDFSTDPRFDNPRAVQIRLPGFDRDGPARAGPQGPRPVRGRRRSTGPGRGAWSMTPTSPTLADAVTGALGGKVGVAPRVFLKKLVADVLDRVDQFPDFDPRRALRADHHRGRTVRGGTQRRRAQRRRGPARRHRARPALDHDHDRGLGLGRCTRSSSTTWSTASAGQSLRPLQDQAVAPVLDGSDALLLAPTAGGKTEAAIFPLLTAMETQRWDGLSVIYVARSRRC